MSALMIAAIVAAASTVGPLLLAHLNGKQRHRDREAEWKRQDEMEKRAERRQDEVAKRAAEVAEQLLDKQVETAAKAAEVARQLLDKQMETAAKAAEAARLLKENNKIVAKTAKATNEKLDVIHTLVNSNMTAALQAELEATKAQLTLMRELISLKVAQGINPAEETISQMEVLADQVKKLAVNLKERLEQTKVADAQIFIAEKRGGEDDEKLFTEKEEVSTEPQDYHREDEDEEQGD